MSIGARIGTGFALGLLLIAVIGASAYVSTYRLVEANRQVTHTHEVIAGLEHILSTLKDAETGQRGFILTGEDRYLEPYEAATGEVQRDLDAMVELTRDHAAQQASLVQVRKLADDKLAELQETITLRRQSGLKAALPVILADRGRQIMDALRDVVAEMRNREQQLLDAQTAAATTSANRTIWTIAAWMPMALLVLGVATVVLMRTVRFGGSAALPGASGKKWAGIALQYISAVILVAVAVVLRMRLEAVVGPLPVFITLYPAVLLAASIGGGGPGIVATICSALAADYWFFTPHGSFHVEAPNDVLALGIFTGSSLFLSVLAERLRRAGWAEALTVAQEQQLAVSSRLNEELSQQAEELSQQSEELAQQNEELQTQSEEIQTLNAELQHREDLLQKLLDAARLGTAERAVLQDICAAAKSMFGPAASAVLVLEPQGDRLAIRAQAGLGPEGAQLETLPAAHCFAELVLAENQTAALADASLRPDLSLIQLPGEAPFQAVLASPMRTEGRPFGVVGVYSHQTQEWTAEQFRLAEWLAAQCAQILDTLRLQAELQESEEKYRDLVQNANSIIIRWDMDGNFTFFNEFAEKFFGFSQSEIIGKNVMGTIVPQTDTSGRDLAAMIEDIKRDPDRYETNVNENVRKSGERVWISWSNRAIDDERGNMIGVLAVGNDITSQKRAEEAIREGQRQNEFLAGILQRASQPFGVGYPDGRLGLINPAFEQLTGYTADELRSTDWASVLTPPEWRDLERSTLEGLQRTGTPVRYQKEYLRKDGSRVPIELLVHISKDEQGRPLYYYSFLTDITERKRAEDALRKSEERLRFALETIHTGAWELDLVDHTAHRSPGHDAIFGHPQALPAWTYDMFLEHVVPADRALVDGKFRHAVATQSDWGFECRIHRADGATRWIWAAGRHHPDAAGVMRKMSGIVQDITERKRDEEALQRTAAEILRQKNLLAVTLASIGDGVIVTDAQGRLTFLNPEAERLTGWTSDAAEGQPLAAVFRIVNEHTRQPVEDPVEKVLQLGTVVGLANHTLLIGKDGREVPIDDSGAPIRQSDGTVQGVVLVFRDCTEQKQAERTLARLAAIVESSDDAILSKDLHGVIQTWNAGAERLFGYRADEAVGQSIMLLLPPERIHEEEQILERVGQGQRVEHLETVRVTKDGRRLDVSVTASPVKNPDGRIIGVSKILRDITTRQRAEQALRQTAEDLARSNKDLEQFAYVASHDLKEPLRMVTGFMSLLKDRCQGQLDAKADEYIAFASDAATRMHGLIDDLLAYSRAGRGELTERTDLGDVFDRVLRSLTVTVQESAAVITHDPLPTLTSHPVELTQVLQNLIGNAIKFRGERTPEIHFGAQRQPGRWLFTVRDNGIGIDPQFAERVFMIFQRLHTRERYPGAGIGLAICKKIVERHGGRIWVESQPGHGATFCFTIPDQGKGQG